MEENAAGGLARPRVLELGVPVHHPSEQQKAGLLRGRLPVLQEDAAAEARRANQSLGEAAEAPEAAQNDGQIEIRRGGAGEADASARSAQPGQGNQRGYRAGSHAAAAGASSRVHGEVHVPEGRSGGEF